MSRGPDTSALGGNPGTRANRVGPETGPHLRVWVTDPDAASAEVQRLLRRSSEPSYEADALCDMGARWIAIALRIAWPGVSSCRRFGNLPLDSTSRLSDSERACGCLPKLTVRVRCPSSSNLEKSEARRPGLNRRSPLASRRALNVPRTLSGAPGSWTSSRSLSELLLGRPYTVRKGQLIMALWRLHAFMASGRL